MTSSGSTLLRYLGRHLLATFKTDHRRAIDRYIDYFGDCAATGARPLARRVTSVDEQAIPAEGPGASVVARVEIAIRAVFASRRGSRS